MTARAKRQGRANTGRMAEEIPAEMGGATSPFDLGDGFRRFADHVPLMIWRTDHTGRTVYHNESWLRFTGRSLDAELTEDWRRSLHPDDFERHARIVAEAFAAQEAFTIEYRLRRHDGAYRWLLDTGRPLRDDPAYAERAARISALTQDLSEWLPELLAGLAGTLRGRVVPPDTLFAYHPPCTLQHGQKLRGGVETHLSALGFRVRVARTEAHLCCGSAGTYSVLQPELAYPLRDRKLAALGEAFGEPPPGAILSANIGCITHLQSGTALPVRHWVEVLDEALSPAAR